MRLPLTLTWLLTAGALTAGALTAPAAEPAPVAAAPAIGVPITYQLPTDGPLPRTWRVTLAVTDAKNPDWIVGQFANGVVRTVTAENQGRFSETWDGLDDNFMPVPPGTYGVKGICMPAATWAVDGEFHSITPRFVTEACGWQLPTTPANTPQPFGGDPVGQPLGDLAVGPNGVAVFCYTYLENGLNNPMFDITKPVGIGQFLRAFPSGGAAGGTSTTTDGESVWSFSTDGGPKFVYRADQRPFGKGAGAYRNNVHLPAGWVTGMACQRTAAGSTVVYLAERGKIINNAQDWSVEDPTQPVDKVVALAGADGAPLGELPLAGPRGLATAGGELHALHAMGKTWAVSSAALGADGVPRAWRQRFTLPAGSDPAGFAADAHGRFYVGQPAANQVLQFDATGKVLRRYGRQAAQAAGRYDRETFMMPHKLAAWTAADGRDRLLIAEHDGPGRVSEWSADDGTLVREFLQFQTKANDGYAIDPEHPSHVYIPGHGGWLTRFTVDLEKRSWTTDAVWPLAEVSGQQWAATADVPRLDHPRFVRVGGRAYLAGARNYVVYRQDGDRWVLSAAVLGGRVQGKPVYRTWHDADGDGRVQDGECTPLAVPGGVFRYHGEQWCDDLSLVSVGQGGREVFRLAADSFDAHGNPVFSAFRSLLADPVFAARNASTADAVHGGNELTDVFDSDWAMADGLPAEGWYVSARGGRNFSANYGAQHKISRYVPDGKGGYALKWRTGRAALGALAGPGEITGAIHLHRPLNGLLSVIDQSRCGVLLYTTDGLYVDTLFPDGRALSQARVGVYSLPGEFFAGDVLPNKDDGRIYVTVGKYTPQLFAIDGWSLKDNPVRPLPKVQPTVTIAAAQIATPSELALSLRGGAGGARLARFAPAVGGAAFDGSLTGWEACAPVAFKADAERTVEVRLMYDPEHLYLRWHARTGVPFSAKPLAPVERIFTHDRLADTLSFYLQSDPAAKPASGRDARPGDVRVVFGLFDDHGTVKPVALGMHATFSGSGAIAQRYATAAGGVAAFAHVAPLAGATLAHRMDEDGKGFVLVAALPRSSFPGLPALGGALRTQVDFEATFAGHAKVWWADRDGSASRETYDEPTEARLYPGAWASAGFTDLGDGVVLRDWQVAGPFGGPGAEALSWDPPGAQKDATRKLFDAAQFPPDDGAVDLTATYTGALVQGYWKDPGEVRWHAATIADLDNRVVLGGGAQAWYATTWVHVPAPTAVTLRLVGHYMTNLDFRLNGEQLSKGELRDETPRPVSRKPVTLKAGWNQVWFRGYCYGFPPFRAGVVVEGEPAALWTLRLSGTPPAR